MKALRDMGALLGRILIALIFLGGVGKFFALGKTAGYMAMMGMPADFTYPLAFLAALVEVAGGLMIVFGVRARAAAFILFLYLIPVTIIFHLMPQQGIQVMKNIAIMGGLLILACEGPGGFSFDRG
jgi:putative oxidoreductase